MTRRVIFIFGVYDGMIKSMIRTATDTFLGEGQIHARGFRDTNEVELTIQDFQAVMGSLANEEVVEHYAPRTISIGMLTSPSDVTTALIYGIDPRSEPPISKLDEAMREGEYLGDDDLRGILVGSKSAENLGIGLGDRVVLTTARAVTGELSQELFRVRGIFHFNIKEADSAMMYIHIDKTREMLGIGPAAHEIALKFKDLALAGDRSLPFWSGYSAGGNEALGWNDIVPQLDGVVNMTDIGAYIIGILVFCIVALTIMNTLFMSLYERMYEFGVLRAIGTRPRSMAGLILLNIMSGLDLPSSGTAILAGKPINLMSGGELSDFRRDHIGFIFQSYNLIPVLSARENIEYVMLLQGISEAERKERVTAILAEVGLGGMEDRKPSQLSGGQQQRVAIARAMVSRPDIILADEPTANLDSVTGRELLDMMLELNRKSGMTFVFSTHEAMVMEHARRLITLTDGSISSDERR